MSKNDFMHIGGTYLTETRSHIIVLTTVVHTVTDPSNVELNKTNIALKVVGIYITNRTIYTKLNDFRTAVWKVPRVKSGDTCSNPDLVQA